MQAAPPPAVALAPGELAKALVAVERGFYEGWRAKSLAPFEAGLGEGATAWSRFGAMDRAAQLRMQTSANASCDVRSYAIEEPRAVRVAPDAAVLYYRLTQDAVCGGTTVDSPLVNTSVYARRGGRWVNVFRTFAPGAAPAAPSGGR